MSAGPRITSIELFDFEQEVRDFGASGIDSVYEPGTSHRRKMNALRIRTDAGVTGEYVPYARPAEIAPTRTVAPLLLGLEALERERIYHLLKANLRHVGRLGLSPLDVALWDLAGKYYNAPVYQLLGGYRKKLPVYASTMIGDRAGGLDSPEAYADFAERCLGMGYKAFKIHPWRQASIERHVELVRTVGQRLGGKMDLMLDPANAFQTFGDALKIGWACDEQGFFWLEDPYEDGGVSHFGHRKLRQLIRTPLLQGERVRGVEPKVDMLVAEATDFIRGDVVHDGITGTMKLAHAAEGLGIDVELHGADPATRHCMASIRNSNYYEWGLLHPMVNHDEDPIYLNDYVDARLDGIDDEGCISVPEGAGLGVEYNWDFIKANQTGYQEFK